MKEIDPFSVQDAFDEYVQNVYREPVSGEAREELRMAFFAGCTQMRMWAEEIAAMHPAMVGHTLNKIDDELTDFMQETMKYDVVPGQNGGSPPVSP